MKVHPLGVIAVCVVALALGVSVAPWLGWTVAATGLVGGAALVATHCWHRHATLLPPVHDAGPDRDHARWYCDRCGHTWPATFTPETRPRLIYSGYDEHKAQRSAVRADVLERERRRLAVKRAGWAQTSSAHGAGQPHASVRRTLEVVPMRRARE